jgi:DNA-directed RNA polymerase specialized sigma24 family protein
MNEILAAEPDPTWEVIAPHLDAALGELNNGDREALLLRYFQRKSAREIAPACRRSSGDARRSLKKPNQPAAAPH